MCNTHAFRDTSTVAGSSPIVPNCTRDARPFDLGEVFDNIFFTFLILTQSKSERPSRVSHKVKASGLIAGYPGATRGFGLT